MNQKAGLIIFLLILICSFSAGSAELLSLEGYSPEQLLDMKQRIEARLVAVQSGDVVYDDDGIIVVWKGVYAKHSGESGNVLVGVQLFNNLDEDVWFNMDLFALNGILIPKSYNYYMMELPAYFSAITSGYDNLWTRDLRDVKESGVESFDNVYIRINLYKDKEDKAPFRSVDARFPTEGSVEYRK